MSCIGMDKVVHKVAAPYVPLSKPSSIDAIVSGKTELWLHEGQKNGEVSGRVVWRFLMENREVLSGCARSFELRAIEAEGLDFFRKHFFGKVIFGVILNSDYWACLYEKNGSIELRSQWVEYPMNANNPFLRRR